MAAVTFGRGVITYTFLVDLEAVDFDFDAMKREAEELNHQAPEKMPDEIRALLDDPQFLAELAVEKRFSKIVAKTRPQGVTVALNRQGKPQGTDYLGPLRHQIESGERSGHLVTISIDFTRSPIDRPNTAPVLLPFPGFTWLTSQILDEPGNGLTLLHFTASQIPA